MCRPAMSLWILCGGEVAALHRRKGMQAITWMFHTQHAADVGSRQAAELASCGHIAHGMANLEPRVGQAAVESGRRTAMRSHKLAVVQGALQRLPVKWNSGGHGTCAVALC